MESLNNCENIQQIKEEFKDWLKKFHEKLSTKNQELKSNLNVKQQRNKELYVNIEKITNTSLDTSTLSINLISNKIQSQLEADVKKLKIKSEQLNKCSETMNDKVEEETKKMHSQFYELITKDDLALKPYHDVEEAFKEVSHKTECCKRKQNENKENFIKKLKEREIYYTEISQTISMLEPIEEEMRVRIQNCNKDFEEKLKSLKLKSIEEANNESNESKELLNDISNMKSQLNIQQT